MQELTLLEMDSITGGAIAWCKALKLVTFGSCLGGLLYACVLGGVGEALLC